MGQIKNIKLHIVTDIKIRVENQTKTMPALTRRISHERFRSFSFSKRPKLRRRSISDSNLHDHFRAAASVESVGSSPPLVPRLRKRSISESNLHRVVPSFLEFSKHKTIDEEDAEDKVPDIKQVPSTKQVPDIKQVPNIKEKEAGDGAETIETIEEVDFGRKSSQEHKQRT